MDAQFNLGVVFYNEGYKAQAKYWWKRAANQGHVDAQFNLGVVFYNEGYKAQAKYWWEQAANQGHVDAQSNLRFFYDMLIE